MLVRNACRWLALLILAWAAPETAPAQEWREVYNPYSVMELHLQIAPTDWDRVRFDQPSQSEGWVPQVAEALMWTTGETPIRVTVRRKGESDPALPSDANPQKVSLKIDINSLVPGQKWHGLEKLSLENGGSDPLKEGFAWLLHHLAAKAGFYPYEAANVGWVNLHINGELKGVLVNVEQRDKQFLQNHGFWKEGATWLYKIDGSSALEVGTGSSPTSTHLCYAPFNSGPGKGGSTGCEQPNLEADLPQWINIRGLFTLGAVEAFCENRDGLFTHSGKNSYAVDFDPPYPRTRLYFPWDQDTTIAQGNTSIYGSEAYQVQLLQHPYFRQVYEQLLRELMRGPFSASALSATLTNVQTALAAALDEDPYVYSSGSGPVFTALRAWVTTRIASVSSQLTAPYLESPTFNQAGGEVVPGFLLTMSAAQGTVYYTLDGSDPRLPGGGIAPGAMAYTTPVPVDKTTRVIARALSSNLWSALPAEATFNIANYANALRISELMYNPPDQSVAGDGENYEFIELFNSGQTTLNLSGFYLDGIDFTFPPGSTLAPGNYLVLARNAAAFSARYPGVPVGGLFWGKLSNEGEKIRIRNADGNTVLSVDYQDEVQWPLSADGLGYSLVLMDVSANPDQPEAWRASSARFGSPGTNDPAPVYGVGVVVNEVLAHTDPPYEDVIELFNPTANDIEIGGWYLSDDFNRTNAATGYNLKKYRIPTGTTVPAGGYRVFYQAQFQAGNSGTPFALSEDGERVYLASANAQGNLTGYLIGAEFGATEQGQSAGRYRTSTGVDFVPLTTPTFGTTNPATLTQFRSGGGAANASPQVGPVVINEIMYSPLAGGAEYLEFLNISAQAVNLGGWSVGGCNFVFPIGTTLGAGNLLLLVDTNNLSAAAFRVAQTIPADVPVFGHSFVLENEGEMLKLERPNTTVPTAPFLIEQVRYNDKSPWPTEADGEGPALERFAPNQYGNDAINWRTVRSGGSPGRVNQFYAGVAISKESQWKYHSMGNNLGTAWRELNYSDTSWAGGDGPLGYGVGALSTVFPEGSLAQTRPITTYLRKEFVVNETQAAITRLKFEAMYDDGVVVYLNGQEVFRSASMPTGAVSYVTAALSYNSIGYETIDLTANLNLLRQGRNVIAVELHQESGDFGDLVWDASLDFDVSTLPQLSTPRMDPPGGIFFGSVLVTITSDEPDAEIYYTLNGTEPTSAGSRYVSPLLVDTSTTVKCRSYKPNYNESLIARADFSVRSPGADSDADGLTDEWELRFFGNDTLAQPEGDPDADGMTNLQEFAARTSPIDAGSVFKVIRAEVLTNSLKLYWTSTTNSVYAVDWLSALSAGIASQTVGAGLQATPPVNSFIFPAPGSNGFLRVRVE